MADVWPIKNVWAILKQEGMEQESNEELKKVITKAWQEIDKDKALCGSSPPSPSVSRQ